MRTLFTHESLHSPRTMLGFYSSLVRLIKWGLVAIILGILIFVIAIPLLTMDPAGQPLVEMNNPNTSKNTPSDPPIMENPKFQGLDSENHPYFMTAKTALQSSEHTITLNKIQADLTLNEGAWMTLLADQGVLDTKEESLLLQGHVQIYHNAGHEMHTSEARIDLRTRHARGTHPIHIQGHLGRIDADSFIMMQKEQRIIFNNHVSVELLP
ncbi:MAG: LPS export ABC transporter periplasmic protein LptC [Alphaproteobacteria bacterium]|nr:MAG: LPS export ABC transporter periplasmic protein LptC [Alphaproteobacteria bacterium]